MRPIRTVTLLPSFLLLAASLAFAAPAVAQPSFSKAFSPSTIGPGSASRLVFTIDNSGGGTVLDMDFTDTLPGDVDLATPATPETSCSNAVLSAPDGGDTITFTDGQLAAGATCTIEVLVTSSTVGTHTNLSGDLTSNAGNSGSATADLTVATDRPGFTKVFSPSSAPLGSRSTLTFTIDNSANGGLESGLGFTDDLPAGLEIASPASSSNTCNGTLTAPAGGSTITFFGGFVLANSSCTIALDVVPTAVGRLDNRTSNLNSTAGNSGRAVDTLESTAGDIVLVKEFLADPVPPGGTVDLEFTILNRTRSDDATDVGFTDNLGDAGGTLTGLAAVGLPPTACGGTLSGTTTLTFTGGTVAAESQCSFTVTLQVPAGATPGIYPNTTSNVEADFGGAEPTIGNQASDDLFVLAAPIFTKEFIDDPTTGGDTVTLRFSITNTDSTSDLTDIAFTDDLNGTIPGLAANGLVDGTGQNPDPITDPCGAGSELTIPDPNDSFPSPPFPNFPPDPTMLVFTGGNLAAAGTAGDSCTFDVVLDVPAGTPSGVFTNTTSELTATPVGTGPASDDLVVVAAPQLTKEFTDDPVAPGGTVTLSFTLSHPAEATSDATGITFTDDLGATLIGLTSLGLPANDVCGAGSQVSESGGILALEDGLLSPGETCTFSVILQVPPGATPGTYPNTTSDVLATVSGLPTVGSPASDDLLVTGLSFTKEYLDDPVIAGDTATLRFTLRNDGPLDAADIDFTDVLDANLPGLTVVSFPATLVCGASVTVTGSATLVFDGGSLLAGTSCSFDLTVQVPAGTADGTYPNLTSNVTATEGGAGVTLPPARDDLEVSSTLLSLSKQFLDDPVQPGGTLTLEIGLTNQSTTDTVGSIALDDDLDAALSGMTVSSLVSNDCGFTVAGVGTGTLMLTGGSLAPSGSCTVVVETQVPAAAPAGVFTNTTSDATGDVGGLAVTGDAASDDFRVVAVTFTKTFDGPTTATGTAVLTFTLTNLDASAGAGSLAFTDDLDAVLAGLVATGLPQSDVCGSGSSISGTSLLTFSGGDLAAAGSPGDSCTVSVTLDVPASATVGTFPNVTSDLTSAGLVVNDPAAADLVIEPPPTFAKAFAPDSVGLGVSSTLTFTIDNTASAVGATDLDFTDNLPAGLEVAAVPNASTTCTGGTLGAVAGSTTFTYTGGSVAAGATCTVEVDVVPTATGSLVNTSGDLTSSSGSSGTATDTLVVNPQPGFAKVFAPDLIPVGGVSTLTFTLDNTASTVDATGLDFTDVLPSGVEVAGTPDASTTCTGGTLTAAAGSGTISYSGGAVAAGASCTVQADVTASAAGSFDNLSGDLTSNLGSSGTAADTLDAVDTDLTLAKSFVSSPVLAGGSVELEFTLTNLSTDFAATALTFTDDLDAVVPGLQAQGLPASDVCGAGSQLTGSSVVTLTGGTLPANGSCTFTVTLALPTDAPAGTHANVTSTLDGVVDGVPVTAPPATDDLVVADLEFTKTFSGSAAPGQSVTLSFTLTNPDPVNAATGLSFTDDLDAFVPGAEAIDLPKSDVCGAGSQLSGTSTVLLTGGSLAGGATCTFEVSVLIPGDAAGTYLNSTSSLEGDVGGSPVSLAPAGAQAELAVGGGILEIPVLDPRALALLALLLAGSALWVLRR